MKVGFDISQTAFLGGVPRYTRNLATELSKIQSLEMEYFYSSFGKPYQGNLTNVKSFRIPLSLLELLMNNFHKIPIEWFIGKIDIFHSSDWIQPPTKAKKVTTFHDVIPLKYPKWSHPKIVEVHKKRLKWVEKEIDLVIAVSETTKQDLLEISDLAEEKIVVIPEGVEDSFKPQPLEKITAFKKKYNLPDSFVLAMGGVGERKNLQRIKEACSNHYDLVIPGETIPYIPEAELPTLYSAAAVLLYASLYEGFGLPVVEAMAAGTPFIVSNGEWAKGLMDYPGLLTDPENIEDMRKQLKRAMDPKIGQSLVKQGLQRAKFFSWEEVAEETARAYKKILT